MCAYHQLTHIPRFAMLALNHCLLFKMSCSSRNICITDVWHFTTAAKSNCRSKWIQFPFDIYRVFQGDLVQLKEMPTGASNELRSKAMDHLVTAHGLRHENINPLIGKYEMLFSSLLSMFLFLFSLVAGGYTSALFFLFLDCVITCHLILPFEMGKWQWDSKSKSKWKAIAAGKLYIVYTTRTHTDTPWWSNWNRINRKRAIFHTISQCTSKISHA